MPVGLKPARGLNFVFYFAAACLAQAQPLDRLVERALASNREYLASLERIREAEALLRQAGVRPAPSLNAEGGSTRLLGAAGSQEYSVAYSHPLELGGKRPKRIAVAALGLEIARAEAMERRRALTFDVSQAYIEAVSASHRSAVWEEIARIDGETLRLVSARVAEGDAAPLERQLLETEIARNEAEQSLAKGRTEASVLALERLGALPPGTAALEPQTVGAGAIPANDALAPKALASRPDLRILELSEAQAQAAMELARAESAPNLTATARYAYKSTTFDQLGFDSAGALAPIRDRENVLTFGLSAPLFAGRRNQGNIQAAIAREREARLRREHLAATIPAEVGLAVRSWEAARKALEIYTARILPQAVQNLGVMREAWRLGQLRFLDVLAEQRRVTELRMAQIDGETGLMKAWAELERAMGGEIR